MNTGSGFDPNAVFGGMADDNNLSTEALTTLTGVQDLGKRIQAGLGTAADALQVSEAFLVAILADDSGSIAGAGNEDLLLEGINHMVAALKEAKGEDDTMVLITTMNRGVLIPFTPLSQVPTLDKRRYRADGATPLYSSTRDMLATVIAKWEEFSRNNIIARSASWVVTDGMNEGNNDTHALVEPVIRDMLLRECHVVGAMGIQDNRSTDFRREFKRMGIQDRWVLTPSSDPHEIRQAFGRASKSTVQASRGAAAYSRAMTQGLPAHP